MVGIRDVKSLIFGTLCNGGDLERLRVVFVAGYIMQNPLEFR